MLWRKAGRWVCGCRSDAGGSDSRSGGCLDGCSDDCSDDCSDNHSDVSLDDFPDNCSDNTSDNSPDNSTDTLTRGTSWAITRRHASFSAGASSKYWARRDSNNAGYNAAAWGEAKER